MNMPDFFLTWKYGTIIHLTSLDNENIKVVLKISKIDHKGLKSCHDVCRRACSGWQALVMCSGHAHGNLTRRQAVHPRWSHVPGVSHNPYLCAWLAAYNVCFVRGLCVQHKPQCITNLFEHQNACPSCLAYLVTRPTTKLTRLWKIITKNQKFCWGNIFLQKFLQTF